MSIIPVPLSGDPDSVANWGARFATAAANLKKAADELRDLTDDSTFISLAVDEIRVKATDARTATERVSVRYDGAGSALSTYAVELRDAQHRANNAISAFYSVDGDSKTAQRHQVDLTDRVKADNGQTPDLVDQLLAATRAVAHLAQQKAAALAEYNAAEADKNAAAARAAHTLADAGADSKLNDSFIEAIEGSFQAQYEWAQKYLAPILKQIHDVLAIINQILSVAALIVNVLSLFIPVLAPLAGLLDALALASGVLMLACSLALFVLGKGSLGQVLGDALTVAVSVFFAAAGPAMKSGMGVATEEVARAGNPATGATVIKTFLNQSKWVLSTGGDVFMRNAAAGDILVEGASELTDDTLHVGLDALPLDFSPDLAPSAAGPDWNAPPPVQVAHVQLDQPFSMQDAVQGPVAGSVGSSLSSPMVVCSAGAS